MTKMDPMEWAVRKRDITPNFLLTLFYRVFFVTIISIETPPKFI
jgi:hypothetical protein